MIAKSLVSIVLPTYNGSHYIDDAVQSCLDQSYDDWELIIVDDASTDDTSDRIHQWVVKDDRIHSVCHLTNRKLPAALNTGFSMVKGDYLTWTSDDNLYEPYALTEMVTFLQQNLEVDIVYTDYTSIDATGHILGKIEVLSPEHLVFGNCVGASFLYKRKVQDDIGPYAEDLLLAEDLDFWLRASCSFILRPLHKNCYRYRIHSSSLTSSQQDRISLAHAKTMVRNLPNMNWVEPRLIGRAYLEMGMHYKKSGQITELKDAFVQVFSKYHMQETDTEYLTGRFLYENGELRPQSDLDMLVDFFPEEVSGVKSFTRKLWAQFHLSKCFEGYRAHQRDTVRRHILKAVELNPICLSNRGLLRIMLWAYIGL